ncbi:dihydrofolate reductase family protein [Cohnella sp. GCM10027633]|uniref:dihydrofolate reductase family protein n=1 Tax=unclassified Cohnella TaxID=2636738 RepID=UPI00364283F1
MRKIIYQMMVTLDGYYSGPRGEIDWHVVDEEFQRYSIEFLQSIDTLMFGRKTFEMMESFWATEVGKAADPIIAGFMNEINKIVFSTSMNTVNWKNARLITENLAEAIVELKQSPGKDIAIFGSSIFSTSLVNLNLIDEYRIIVNPVFLGDGRSVLQGITTNKVLKLIESKSFTSGNVLLRYEA